MPASQVNDTSKERTRQAQLKAHCFIHGIEQKALAIKLGVTQSYISRVFAGERKSPRIIRQLIAAGIPANLLPTPKTTKVNESKTHFEPTRNV
jgi:transcriptional regulator with XRE-family HTH domain